MYRQKPSRLSYKYLIWLLIPLILAAGGYALYAYYQIVKEYDYAIQVYQEKVYEQERLTPLYQKLRQYADYAIPGGLPDPNAEKLAKNMIPHLPVLWGKICEQSGFELLEIKPHIDAVTDDARLLKCDLTLKGDMKNFQNFWLISAKTPYLAHVERIQIMADREAARIRLVVWLNME